MKLASFFHKNRASYGIVDGEWIIDLGGPGAPFATLRQAIGGGYFEDAAGADRSSRPRYRLAEVVLDLPLPDGDKVLCVGRNYRSHAAEVGVKIPDFPHIFIRMRNSLVADGQPLLRPAVSEQYDFEGELALVIGKAGRHIPRASAMSHVFGYTCFNDGSVRDVQLGHSLAAGKNFFRSGSIGPWIVTADEAGPPEELTVSTWLNGERMQHASLSGLIFGLPELIAYCSTFTELLPGDVLATGTPDGVGLAREPKLWMKPGDRIEVDISGIGRLANPVEAEIDSD